MRGAKHWTLFGLIRFSTSVNGQYRFELLHGQIFMSEEFMEAKKALEDLEQVTCAVDYYPIMAAKELNQNHRL